MGGRMDYDELKAAFDNLEEELNDFKNAVEEYKKYLSALVEKSANPKTLMNQCGFNPAFKLCQEKFTKLFTGPVE